MKADRTQQFGIINWELEQSGGGAGLWQTQLKACTVCTVNGCHAGTCCWQRPEQTPAAGVTWWWQWLTQKYTSEKMWEERLLTDRCDTQSCASHLKHNVQAPLQHPAAILTVTDDEEMPCLCKCGKDMQSVLEQLIDDSCRTMAVCVVFVALIWIQLEPVLTGLMKRITGRGLVMILEPAPRDQQILQVARDIPGVKSPHSVLLLTEVLLFYVEEQICGCALLPIELPTMKSRHMRPSAISWSAGAQMLLQQRGHLSLFPPNVHQPCTRHTQEEM